MKIKNLTTYIALPLIITPLLSSISFADEEPDNADHQHEVPATDEQDPTAVTLEAMVISSEQRTDAFESIHLIKKDLGIATDGAD
ncbi:MAG: hypothetical protein GQ581_03440, partial [Methyloprofundus sp.]|nr:hypothetical protein [Methyloprofundus sp.]